MEKREKTRLVCMNCLHSKIVDKQEDDPKETRLIVLWSCDKCSEESDEIEFYDYQMRQLDIDNL
jgi:hypothetical protein